MATDDVPFQLLIWGYAYTGEIDEPGALTAELRPSKDRCTSEMHRLFDGTAEDLTRVRVSYGDEEYHRPPDHWALPWVSIHRMRQEMAGA